MQHDSGQPASRPGQPESCVCSYLACNLLHLVLWYLEGPCPGRTDSLLVRQVTGSLDIWEKRENFIEKNLIEEREPKVLGSVKIILVTSSWTGVSWDQEAISTLPSTPSFVADSYMSSLHWKLVSEFSHQEDIVYMSLCGMLNSSMNNQIPVERDLGIQTRTA